MNRSDIDDLLGSLLSGWYESIADWVPPGRGSAQLCVSCPSSILVQAVDVSEWPHDLVHQLAESLESALLQIVDSLPEPPTLSYRHVEAYLASRVLRHAADLQDVFRECVEPRLDAWATAELQRVFAKAGRHS